MKDEEIVSKTMIDETRLVIFVLEKLEILKKFRRHSPFYSQSSTLNSLQKIS